MKKQIHTVGDLMAALQKHDPDTRLEIGSEDTSDGEQSLFVINTIDEIDCETGRNDDGMPFLKYGKSENSVRAVFLDITSDY